jgi:hypothetical protein
MQRDVEETAKPRRQDLRERTDRRGIEHAVLDRAQPPGPFGHQHPAVREEGDAPRVIEPLGDDRDVQASAARGKIPGACAQRVDRRGTTAPTATRCRRGAALASRARRGGLLRRFRMVRGERHEDGQRHAPRRREAARSPPRDRFQRRSPCETGCQYIADGSILFRLTIRRTVLRLPVDTPVFAM